MNYRTIMTCLLITSVHSHLFGIEKLRSYVKLFNIGDFTVNGTDNELWRGLLKDCSKRTSFSCIQKNVYSYLDDTFDERDNITVFDGFVLTKNDLNYGACASRLGGNSADDALNQNLVEEPGGTECKEKLGGDEGKDEEDAKEEEVRGFDNYVSPIEEVTVALHDKTVKFLANRDYELQLPDFFFEGSTIKISPREVDENGALLRVDFRQRAVESQGRIFKKIKKFIKDKLLMSFLALLLIIKLIKVKFMFVIPFLFGIGTAKKLFLKLLLFLVPAFAHIFKLCSSYYSNQGTKFHHHHHQIAHHHHHVPVPVPVPAYHHDSHHDNHHEEEFDGYDYAHPHIQYRKDVEELKEWGIEPYEESNVGAQHLGIMPGPYGMPQYAVDARPVNPYQEKHGFPSQQLRQDNRFQTGSIAAHAQNLAYAGHIDDGRLNRVTATTDNSNSFGPRPWYQSAITTHAENIGIGAKPRPVSINSANFADRIRNDRYPVPQRVGFTQGPQIVRKDIVQDLRRTSQISRGNASNSAIMSVYEDEFYGPILERLDETFAQLRFAEEGCRERLICSMYKNPSLYSPHSNLVSNELSRDPQELTRSAMDNASSRRFHRYLSAARLGQDGGDCLRAYPCHINTE